MFPYLGQVQPSERNVFFVSDWYMNEGPTTAIPQGDKHTLNLYDMRLSCLEIGWPGGC